MKIEAIPQTLEEFIALRNNIAHNPEGGLACFIVALHHFASGHPEGLSMIIICRDIDDLNASEAPGNYKGYALSNTEHQLLTSQLNKQNFIPASYFSGATPENDYSITGTGAEFVFTTNAYSGDINSGRIKIMVQCSGAASPRPTTLVRNDKGIWKVKEYSSLIVGIQTPKSLRPKDDL